MATFTLTLPPKTKLTDGKQITFKAPADCTGITGVIINGTTYSLMNSANTVIVDGSFKKNAMISIVIDAVNHNAYLLNENLESSDTIKEIKDDIQALEVRVDAIETDISTNIKPPLSRKFDTITIDPNKSSGNAITSIERSGNTTILVKKEKTFLTEHPPITVNHPTDPPAKQLDFVDNPSGGVKENEFSIPVITVGTNGHITSVHNQKYLAPKRPASATIDGLMSAADKAKLDGIDKGANKYTHYVYPEKENKTTPSDAATWKNRFGDTFKIPNPEFNAEGHIVHLLGRDITIPDYTADASTKGLMSAAHYTKLEGIANNANNYTHHTQASIDNPEPTGPQTPGFGDTFNIAQTIVDGEGHVTAVNTKTVKIPESTADDSNNGLMTSAEHIRLRDNVITGVNILSNGLNSNAVTDARREGNKLILIRDKEFLTEHPTIPVNTPAPTPLQDKKLDFLTPDNTFSVPVFTVGDNGHVVKHQIQKFIVPDQVATQTRKGLMNNTDKIKVDNSVDTVTTTQTNESVTDAITDYKRRAATTITKVNSEIKVNEGYEFLIKHPPVYSTADSTPPHPLSFGGTFSAMTDVTRDTYQHVLSSTKTEFTIPSNTATQTVNGLMSADDKKRLDNNVADSVTTTGTGNAVTSITKSETSTDIIVNKDTTFLSGKKYNNVVLTTTWDENLTQQINIEGVTSADLPIIDLDCDASNYEDAQYEFQRIYRAESVSGGIRFYAESATKMDINLFIVIVKSVMS